MKKRNFMAVLSGLFLSTLFLMTACGADAEEMISEKNIPDELIVNSQESNVVAVLGKDNSIC